MRDQGPLALVMMYVHEVNVCMEIIFHSLCQGKWPTSAVVCMYLRT